MNSTNGTNGKVTWVAAHNVSPTTVRLDPSQGPEYTIGHTIPAHCCFAAKSCKWRCQRGIWRLSAPSLQFPPGQPDRRAIGLGYLTVTTVVPQLLGQSWEFCLQERPSRPGLLFNR